MKAGSPREVVPCSVQATRRASCLPRRSKVLERIRKDPGWRAHAQAWTLAWERKVTEEIRRLHTGRISEKPMESEISEEYPYFSASASDGSEMLRIIKDFVKGRGLVAHLEDICQEIAEAVVDGRISINEIGKGFKLLKRTYFNKVFDWKHGVLSMDISIFDGGLLPHEIIPSTWPDPFQALCLKEDNEERICDKRRSEYVRRIAGAGTFKPMTFSPFSG